MLNEDDILQKKISDLENGAPVENVLQDLPTEAKELEALIRLAAAVRDVPHPEPLANQITAQREQVMAAAIRNTQPAARNLLTGPLVAPKTNRTVWNWFGVSAVAAAAGSVALFLCISLVVAGYWFSNRATPAARVESLTGQVQIATNKTGTTWKNIDVGYHLQKGDRLRTMGASSATLVYAEGTHTFVSANSDLAFADLNSLAGNVIQVKIDQNAGETWNKVTPFNGKTKSYFLVHTPSGTASVHGTSFNVRVSETGKAQFSVTTGVVKVQNDGSEVTLLAGQATAADTSGAIAAPTYQFNIQGAITNIDDTGQVWTVSGIQFQVADTTSITGFTGSPQLGDMVNVSGRILENNVHEADTITYSIDTAQNAFFTGLLEKNEGEQWQIGGKTVQIDANTALDPNLTVGTPVKVTVNILEDGTWLALKIESLVERPENPAPNPSATADPRAMPIYTFAPDVLEASSCGSSDFNLTGGISNSATNAKDYAANLQLGYLIDRGGEFVSAVDLTPDNWARLDAKQTAAFNIHVTMNEQWKSAAPDSEVKIRIYITSASNRPDHLNGRLTVTIHSGCTTTPTPTTTSTQPAEITGTPALSPTIQAPTAQPSQADQCTGVNPHPTGLMLAQRYGVPYAEIMKWFCQHYGFGEIDLAYSLSRAANKPVEEIFAMRASGMGWGEIKKILANNNDFKQNDNSNDNNNNQGNQNPGKKPKKNK